MLSPASRGALLTAAIFLYEFMGLVGGYYAGRLYKSMKGREWKKAAFLTATLYPGIIFSLGVFINFFIWGKHSSGAIPFTVRIHTQWAILLTIFICVKKWSICPLWDSQIQE